MNKIDFDNQVIVIEASTLDEAIYKAAFELIENHCRNNAPKACELCGRKFSNNGEALRPYGPNYKWICVPCGLSEQYEEIVKKNMNDLDNMAINFIREKSLLKVFRIDECPRS